MQADAPSDSVRSDPRVAARFVVLGPGGASIVALDRQRLTIGRDPENAIVLASSDVSRAHCSLEAEAAGGHVVVDLGSRNGILVNDRRVERAALERFDRLRVGPYDLVYLDDETDADRVLDLLRPSTSSTVADDDAPGSMNDRLLWLILMTQELRCEADTHAVLDTLLEELLRWARFARVLLVLLDAADVPSAARARNVGPEHLTEAALTACRPLVLQGLIEGQVVTGATALGGSRATVCVPLTERRPADRRRRFDGTVRGALLFGAGDEAPRALTSEDLRLLRTLTRQIAMLLANARLHRQATTDSLTQLRSRACVEQTLRDEADAARRRAQPLSVVLLDVDDFKAINDTYGHSAGDEVLAALARRVSMALRPEDTAGRWGGEELLLVLPNADREVALRTARAVVAEVATRPFLAARVRVTVSAGVATFPAHGRDVDQLVRGADLALYAAKRRGKNQALAFEERLGRPGSDDEPATESSLPRPTRAALDAVDAVAWLQCELLAPVALRAGPATLGRSERCDVVLPHPSVSRKHATLYVEGADAITVEDHSSNGSIINGVPVAGRMSLRVGDRLTIGPYQFDVIEREPPGRLESQTSARLELPAQGETNRHAR
jgi:diguanylate cyclase (GGDEF)-like protein